MLSKAVFLDKDGTLVEDVPYNVDPDLIRLEEGALEGLSLLREHGYRLIVVTNQSGVARGFFNEQDLEPVEHKLREMLSSEGIHLDGFYYCPHYPDGDVPEYTIDCFCRKPRPGMIYQAGLAYHIDLPASWLIGDILHDIEAGNRAGCRTILLDNGHETEWKLSPVRQPDFRLKNLHEAARRIVSKDSKERNS